MNANIVSNFTVSNVTSPKFAFCNIPNIIDANIIVTVILNPAPNNVFKGLFANGCVTSFVPNEKNTKDNPKLR